MPKIAAFLVVAAALVAGCASRAPAPVDDRRPVAKPQPKPPVAQQTPVPGALPGVLPSTSIPARAGYHLVKRGETLYSIALEHGADYRDVARWNNLDDPTRIRVGQELRVTPPEDRSAVQVGSARLPGEIESRPLGSAPQTPVQAQSQAPGVAADAGTKTAPKALRLPYSEQNLALLQRGESPPAQQQAKLEPRPEPAKPAPPGAPAAQDRDPDAIDFAWPARGRVLSGFSEPNNKGLDIAGKPGDPVVAAAAGRVMYTGTGIRGYGKLIVIRHDNNFNSVYAHNREILVKEGQNVARGQRIAELGDTDADGPKLHFEIRKSGKPVDPAKYLPPQ
jgi:lipoprotein NlpD